MSMVSLEDLAIVLQSRMSEIFMISASYTWVVKIISWFFITLSLSVWMPIAFLITLDFFLWVWRLASPARAARNRRRRESLSHPVST